MPPMSDRARCSTFLLATIFSCFLVVSGAFAQSTSATLTGVITDGSGGVLPGASVAVTNTATGGERAAATDTSGLFQVPNVDAGRYRVVVSLSGFADATREVEVLARQTIRVELQLQVAGTAEFVDVTAVRPVIETDRSTIDSSVSGADINRLALNFRATNNTSPLVVATLSQGVQQDRSGGISIAGAEPFNASFSVDGISTQRIRGGGPSKDLFPSVESIEEFKVSSASNNAEFMQVADITTTTKSGTNQLHGTGFWFFQDSALSGTTRFTPRDAAGDPIKPEIRANSFGLSAGGPIVRNLSSLSAQLRNPFTGQPYAGNQIPVNPVSARVLEAFYPRQNQSNGAATDRPNYVLNAPGDATVNGFDGRGDYLLSLSQRVFGRMTWKDVDKRSMTGSWNTLQGDQVTRTELRQLVGSHNWTLSSSLLNEIRVGWSNTVDKDGYANADKGAELTASTGIVGLPGAPVTGGFPHFELTDGSFISTGGTKPFDVLSRVVQATDTLTWVKGRHTFKGGFDLQYDGWRSGAAQDVAEDGQEQLQPARRHRVAAVRRHQDRDSRRRGLVHGAASGIGQLLDGGHRHGRVDRVREHSSAAVRLSEHLVLGIGTGLGAGRHARLPPRQPDRHARSADDAMEPDVRARARVARGVPCELHRIVDERSDLES